MAAPISGPIDLRGQTAIVTGAARGIGQAICRALAREGADIACCDILSLEQTVAQVTGQGRRALALKCDVTSPSDVESAVQEVLDQWGRIDILVNCSGILGDSRKPLNQLSIEEWKKVMEVNLLGYFLMTRAVWDHMISRKWGKIVCLGSIAGRMGGVLAGPHYCASKGGIHSFVKWVAKNGAKTGIYCNGIAPGPTETPMIQGEGYTADIVPLGRLGRPEDIAEVAVFLASQASNYITGNIIDVNGGILMV